MGASLGSWVSVTFVYCVETAKDTAVVAVECENKTVHKLNFEWYHFQ